MARGSAHGRTSRKLSQNFFWPSVQAHRGVWGQRPENTGNTENTLESFELARRAGFSAVELDVRLSSDGQMVVFHDSDLVRLFSERLAVENLSHEQLWRSYRIPTLDMVHGEFGKDLHLNIEIKCERWVRSLKPSLRALLRCLRKNQVSPERHLISSFHPWLLFQLQKELPLYQRGLLISPVQAKVAGVAIQVVNPLFVHWPERLASRRFCDVMHRQGRRVAAWTVQTQDRFQRLQQNGVDSLICDPGGYPAALQSEVARVQRESHDFQPQALPLTS